MSLHDIFMQRAALEHQNMLNSDNAGIALQSLAQGVAQGIVDEQQKMKNQKEIDYKFDKELKLANIKYGQDKKVDEIKQKRETRIARQAELNNATKLRTEFLNRQEVKDFITVNTNVKAMEGLLNQALSNPNKQNMVAIDQGIITMYNKLTDPQSVVRESEYARTPENLPTVNRIVGAIQKVQAGGAGLTDDDRKALVEGAKIILKERGGQYNTTLQEYNDLSLQYGLDQSIVNRGMKPYEDIGQQSADMNISVPEDKKPLVESYMKKYPNRSRDQIIRAMKNQGVL